MNRLSIGTLSATLGLGIVLGAAGSHFAAADAAAAAQVFHLAGMVTPPSAEKGLRGKDIASTPGGDIALLDITGPVAKHMHAHTDEWIYVISGSGKVTVGDAAPVTVKAGDLVTLPHGTPHSVAAGATLRVLAVAYPKDDPKDMEMLK